jgi:hypothetical protein
LRFADEEVNVCGHDHITDDDELISSAHLLHHSQKQIATVRRAEERLPPITTTGDEVKVSSAIVAFEFAPHGRRIAVPTCCAVTGHTARW